MINGIAHHICKRQFGKSGEKGRENCFISFGQPVSVGIINFIMLWRLALFTEKQQLPMRHTMDFIEIARLNVMTFFYERILLSFFLSWSSARSSRDTHATRTRRPHRTKRSETNKNRRRVMSFRRKCWLFFCERIAIDDSAVFMNDGGEAHWLQMKYRPSKLLVVESGRQRPQTGHNLRRCCAFFCLLINERFRLICSVWNFLACSGAHAKVKIAWRSTPPTFDPFRQLQPNNTLLFFACFVFFIIKSLK